MNWQPLVHVLVGRLVQFLIATTWLAWLFGPDRVGGWLEALMAGSGGAIVQRLLGAA